MSPLNVLYLAAIENPVSSPLFTNQVVRLCREIATDPSVTLELAVLQPITTFRDPRARRALAALRRDLAGASVRLTTRTLPLTSRSFYLRRWQIPMFLEAGLAALRGPLGRRPDVIHCRSYPATRLALRARKRHRFGGAIAFDTRGQYPEEGTIVGRWRSDSPDYTAWKEFEKAAFHDADVVANVSAPHSEAVRPHARPGTLLTLPTVVDVERFPEGRSAERRGELGWAPEASVVAFAGSFNRWRTPDAVFGFFSRLREHLPAARLLILTNSRVPLATCAARFGVTDEEWTHREALPELVPEWLSACDLGLLVEPKTAISAITLGSKCGEYLAAGLPLIVCRHAGGAAAVVDAHDVGIVITTDESGIPTDPALGAAIESLTRNARERRERCRRVARDVFDVRRVAERWRERYAEIASKEAPRA